MKRWKKLTVLALAIIVATATVFVTPGTEVEAASKPKTTKITYLKSNSPGKVTVKVKKIKGCKYQIQAATDSKMKSNRKTIKTSSTKKTFSLKQGKKYYVRVRTYKKVGKKIKYSKWSAKKKVTVRKSGSTSSGGSSSGGSSSKHVHNYNIPVTKTVLQQVPFSEAENEWGMSGYSGTRYRCMCKECQTYGVYFAEYANSSGGVDLAKSKKYALDHMNKVNSPGWKEEVYAAHNVCNVCGTDVEGKEGATHYNETGCGGSWSIKSVLVKTIKHLATSRNVTTYKCSCGAVK